MAISKDGTIEYNLTRTSRKNVNITVKNDGVIYVSAPKRVTLADINKIVLSKREWIINAQKNVKARKIIKNNIILKNNSYVRLYGKVKKILLVPCMKNYVALNDDTIIFYIKEEYADNQKYKSTIFNKFLKEELQKTVDKFAFKYLKILGLSLDSIEFRAMKSRWGTCIPSKKKVLFNSKLVHCPVQAIEYVVLHEIVHLIHPNHSKAFYNTIEIYMPDWKERKKILQDYLIQ